jgi:hypothetical protein
MAKLQSTEIVGTTSVSNPPNGSACIWYDTADRVLKVTFCGNTAMGAWAGAGNMVQARWGLTGFGSRNAALGVGGCTNSATVSSTEGYNGSSWASRNVLTNVRTFLGGAGTQNAGLVFAGSPDTGETNFYNGSTWASRNSLAVARRLLVGSGGDTSALAIGGYTGGSAVCSQTEFYNGSNWASRNVILNARRGHGGAGGSTTTLIFAGNIGNVTTGLSEAYNGSSWTSRNCMTYTIDGVGGIGDSKAALATGGYVTNAVSCYDGQAWSYLNSSPLPTNKGYMGTAGTTSAALAFGGVGGSIRANTDANTFQIGMITCKLT